MNHLRVARPTDDLQKISRMYRMTDAGFRMVASWNPYWNARSRTFEDPDGYRVVIQNEEPPFKGGPDIREEGELAL